MNIEIVKFLKKLVLFLPIAVLILLAQAIILMSGENLNIESIYRLQSGKEVIYGPIYTNYDVEYKSYNVLKKKPETLIIGTSRVMQFNPNEFEGNAYNAGGIVSNIGQLPDLTEFLLQNNIKPKRIIVGLDQYFFNEKWDYVNDSDKLYIQRLINNNPKPSVNMINVLKELIKGKIDLGILFKNYFGDNTNIGLNGIIYQNGFKESGMYTYGKKYIYGIEHDENFIDTFERIKKGERRFEYADEINSRALVKLEKFLEICHKNNIEVIGIIPPYAPSVYHKMVESANYLYLGKIYNKSNPIFSKFGYKLYDFTYMPETTDEMFVDGFHGDDYVYSEIRKTIIE